MLQPQITFAFSPYTALYDLIVPKDIMPRQNNVKAKTKERYKIEAKNSELKHRHGYHIASSSGLLGLQMQGAMAIFAVNLTAIQYYVLYRS